MTWQLLGCGLVVPQPEGVSAIHCDKGDNMRLIGGNILRSSSSEQPGACPGLRLHCVQRFIIQGNRCSDGRERPTQTRGIVESGGSDWNLISGNLCVGLAEPVTVVGPNSRAEGNLVQ